MRVGALSKFKRLRACDVKEREQNDRGTTHGGQSNATENVAISWIVSSFALNSTT
jgi:hypothetical protein